MIFECNGVVCIISIYICFYVKIDVYQFSGLPFLPFTKLQRIVPTQYDSQNATKSYKQQIN